ncbi:hypothetical protein KR044_008992 [Drosophila immigrans]|nr:hypothetical protein KR044_008992 [Drosophila immigrans]
MHKAGAEGIQLRGGHHADRCRQVPPEAAAHLWPVLHGRHGGDYGRQPHHAAGQMRSAVESGAAGHARLGRFPGRCAQLACHGLSGRYVGTCRHLALCHDVQCRQLDCLGLLAQHLDADRLPLPHRLLHLRRPGLCLQPLRRVPRQQVASASRHAALLLHVHRHDVCPRAVAIGILPLQFDTSIFGLNLSSWRVFLIADVSITVLALCGLHLLPETPKYQLVQGQVEEALQTLRYIYAQNSGQAEADYPVERLAQQSGGASLSSVHGVWDAVRLIWHQTVPLFYRSRVAHTLNICLIQFMIYGIAQGIFMWFPTILNELGKDTSQGSLLCHVLQSFSTAAEVPADGVCIVNPDISTYQVMITIGGAFTIIYLIFAYTIDVIGKRNLLIGWMILTMVCLVLLHYITQFAPLVIALTLVMAIGNCGGLVSTMAMEFYPTQINAMGMCFIMMIGRLGAVVGSNLMGRLLFNSCDITFWTLLGIVLVLTCMSYFLPDRARSKDKTQTSPTIQISSK